MTWLEGIDISYAQAVTPKLAGLSFVAVKASEGNFRDPRYAMHAANVKAAGLPLIAYHFGRREWPVATQLATFQSVASDADAWALDYERSNVRTLMTETQARQFIKGWQAHDEIGLYGSEFNPWRLFPADSYGANWRWVANWGANPPQVAFDLWQYQGVGLDRDRATQSSLDKVLRKPAAGGDVKFSTLYEPAMSVAAPKGTSLRDFTGAEWTTLDTATTLETFGLADAHSGQFVVRVNTAHFYADGVKRPTLTIAVIPGGVPQ
jgi:hypothetical protein